MAQLIKPGDIKIVTKNNEILVNISLDLNIKLDGSVTNLNLGVSNEGTSNLNKKEEDSVNWAIPDFTTNKKIKFGKET